MWGIPQATVKPCSYFDWLRGSVRIKNKRRMRLFSFAKVHIKVGIAKSSPFFCFFQDGSHDIGERS